MSLTYTYDASLPSGTGRERLDGARYLVGDTDVTLVGSGYPYALRADETYSGAFQRYGWQGGLVFILQGLLTEFGQQPDVYAQANGVSYKMGERIKVWRQLIIDTNNGKVVDPLTATGQVDGRLTSGTANLIPNW